MKKEIQLQAELVDQVNSHEGFAFKLAHKFLVGVPDLFIKMPGFPGTMLEAKRDKLPVKLQWIVVTLAPLQLRFLKKAFNAGMTSCGVASFAMNDKQFAMCILPVERFFQAAISVPIESYRIVPLQERKALMLDVLVEHLKQHSRQR